MGQLIFLSVTDFKLIFRDPSLRIFLMLPLLIFAIVLLGLPTLVQSFEGVERFVPIVLMGATMQTSTMFGFIYCMVLIHEKDIGVAKVYGVLPVSKMMYVASRLMIPFLVAVLFTFVLLVIQPFFILNGFQMLTLSMLCGLLGPMLALGVTILSKNKMEGMTWFKLINLLVTIPLVAFFVEKVTNLFSIIPSHWAFQALDRMVNGENPYLYLSIGFVYSILILIILIRLFARRHFD